MTSKVVTAAVLIIGNEILSGRTQDTNLRDIALTVGQWGIRIAEARVVADIESTIASVVNELRAKYDYVFTTGGIGPTHDDITAQSIAKAFAVPLIEHPQIATMIRSRKAPPEVIAAAMRMAFVPEGARLIENTTGGPPGFAIGNVHVLAGIPVVMRAMLASLEGKLETGAVVQSRSVSVFVGESRIAEALAKIQDAHPSVEIGSYPFFRDGQYGTTLVARSTDVLMLESVASQLTTMIVAMGAEPVDEQRAGSR